MNESKGYVDWRISTKVKNRFSNEHYTVYEVGFHVNGCEYIKHSEHETNEDAAEELARAVLRVGR